MNAAPHSVIGWVCFALAAAIVVSVCAIGRARSTEILRAPAIGADAAVKALALPAQRPAPRRPAPSRKAAPADDLDAAGNPMPLVCGFYAMRCAKEPKR